MNKVALCVICLLVTTASVLAQAAAPDAAELTKLLNDFLAGASRNDPAAHERFWADDLIYTRSAGRRVNKADIMHDVRSAPAPKPDDPKTIYTAEDIRIQQYGSTAIVAFRLVATTEIDGAKQVQNLLNSGTFLKRNGKWQVVNWQSTRMPRSEAENKADVAATVAAFHDALVARDSKKLQALTDPDFIWMHGSGGQITQLDLIEAASKLNYAKPGALSGGAISLHGETALVHERQYLMTLVNQAGVWKIVTFQTAEPCVKM